MSEEPSGSLAPDYLDFPPPAAGTASSAPANAPVAPLSPFPAPESATMGSPPAGPPVASGVPAPQGLVTHPVAGPLFQERSGPPPLYRPDQGQPADRTTTMGVAAPVTARPGPPEPQPPTPASPEPAGSVQSRWGWRALVAFLLGGLVATGGFVAGWGFQDGASSADGEVGAVAPASAATTVTPTRPLAPGAVNNEPAAFVAEVLSPSVVQIGTEFGVGSGVIYSDSLIITNNHVVQGVNEVAVRLNDGRTLPGTIVGTEPGVDIAVVSVGPNQGLMPATLAVDEDLRVGQTAVAIGSPFELQQTVTEGIVSAVNRPVFNGRTFISMIQTDAPINPGNSGGALADREGRVIGINTAIQTDGTSSTNAGVGFAIPIDTAVRVAEKLIAGEEIVPGFLGISGDVPRDGSAGVEVVDVTPNTGAEAAGVREGDRIVAIDGAPVTLFEELAGVVGAYSPGEEIQIDLIRDGVEMQVMAELGVRPDE